MKGYQIKITIKGSKPPVWRRIQIPKDMSFYQLHKTIQILFGWMDYHLYEFKFPKLGVVIGSDALEDDDFYDSKRLVDEDHALFEFMNEGTKIDYIYDFGDDWQHLLQIEKEVEMKSNHPILIKWKGDNFAEDAGNVFGYEEILRRSQDKSDPEHTFLSDWLDKYHNPFDASLVQLALDEVEVNQAREILDASLSQELDDALLQLKQVLTPKNIINLSLIIMKSEQETKYIGFNKVDDDITLQIYDNETAYLQGVDYVSSATQGNLYANAICMISTAMPLPIDSSWISSDGRTIIKKMRTGYLPIDLNKEEAETAVIDLRHIKEVIQAWKKNSFPTYETNECLYATLCPQGWDIKKQLIRLHPERTKLHLSKKKIKEFETEVAHQSNQIKVDLIAIPQEHIMNFQMDVVLIMEGNSMDSDATTSRECLKDFKSMNQEILDYLSEFLYEDGIPEKILVNNENMRFMLSGLCEDLKINLGMEHFITKTQEDFASPFEEEDDMEILETMARMDNKEFFDFIKNMDPEDLGDFQEFLRKYIDMDELDQIFQDIEDAEEVIDPKKKFDA